MFTPNQKQYMHGNNTGLDMASVHTVMRTVILAQLL